MKGKIGVVLSVCLLSSFGAIVADAARLAEEVVLGAVRDEMPKLDLSATSVGVGSAVAAAGAMLYLKAGDIAPRGSQVSNIIEKALLQNAYGDDVLRALGVLGTGAGVATFFENGPTHRRTMMKAFVGGYCYSQLATWGTKVEKEAEQGAVQAIIAVPVLNELGSLWRTHFK